MARCNLASVLTDEVFIALVQKNIVDCLNERLILNRKQPCDSFEDTVVSCFEASLIDDNTCYACMAITHKGNKARHDAAAYLMVQFGHP